MSLLFLSLTSVPMENVHPLQGGLLRRKYRLDRRPGMPIEPIWAFYPKYAWSFAKNSFRELRLLLWILSTTKRIYKDKNRHAYTDQALTPVTDDETEKLELFTHSEAARQSVKHVHKIAQLTGANRSARADLKSTDHALIEFPARCVMFEPCSGGSSRRRSRSSAPPRG